MTSAIIGHGTTFATGDGGAPEAFTELAEVTAITAPALARDTVDATHMGSTEGWREFIPGLKDGGEVSLELNFVSATNMAALMAELNLSGSAAVKNRKITFPDDSIFAFAAILTAVEPEAPVDDKIAASATFKVTGKPTLT